ncbi:hypothetical protein Cs7R123_36360 [Catellatospora sp. TT07R-123]|uniref:hypothetical protein n=1 Tax=Catellatospora sp. TT07R-123 TaxID=2733863 RepID=UPI001B28A5E1|nr:hypothetical protein [Catellatospora sp. TT07R-123]GHJ46294.1 hypothetical protein Cs7R123_36360 [Catellatospora sp. TT07R-123]
MADMIGGKYTVRGQGRPGRLGTWHVLSTEDGKVRGGVRLEERALADHATAQRVGEVVQAVAALRLPGLLNVTEQLVDGRYTWLITSASPSPTLAQVIASGVPVPPEVPLLIATDTAQTLLKLHEAGRAHGDLRPETIVLSGAGAALLAETGYTHALAGTTAGPGHDTAGWAKLLNYLASGNTDPAVAQLLRQAAQQAEATGGSAGLTSALPVLTSGGAKVAGFGDRGAVKALAANATAAAAGPVPVSAPPVALPPVSPGSEATVKLVGGSQSAPVPPRQAPAGVPPQAAPVPPQQPAPPVAAPAVAPDGATRLGNRAAEEQRRAASGPPAAPQSAQPDVNLRFGQGVPPAPPAWQLAAAANARPPRKRSASRRIIGFLSALMLVALLVAVGYKGWQWWQSRNPVAVTAIDVKLAKPITDQCDVKVDLVGTIRTDGGAGKVTYEWVRMDGQSSGALEQTFRSGQTSAEVHLYWDFKGEGTKEASATLRVLGPPTVEGSTAFTYHCKR